MIFKATNKLEYGEKPVSLLRLKDYELMNIVTTVSGMGITIKAGNREAIVEQLGEAFDFYVRVQND